MVGEYFLGVNGMDTEIVKLLCLGGLAVIAFLYVCWSTYFCKEKPMFGYRKDKSEESIEDWLRKHRGKAAHRL